MALAPETNAAVEGAVAMAGGFKIIAVELPIPLAPSKQYTFVGEPMKQLPSGGTLPKKNALERLVQKLNARPPMLVTLLGNVTVVKFKQSWNEVAPMLATLLGIDILVRLEQPAKALSVILVTLLGIVYPFPLLPIGYCISVVCSSLNRTPAMLT